MFAGEDLSSPDSCLYMLKLIVVGIQIRISRVLETGLYNGGIIKKVDDLPVA